MTITSTGSLINNDAISLSGGISFSGLGSGTDFDAMIDQLKKIEEIPKNRLEAWRADWQQRVDAFDQLIEGITAASKKLSAFNNMSTFLSKLVSSSNSSAVSATATADAPTGSYRINVVQLATNGMITTQDTLGTSKDSVVTTADSKFVYEYGGERRELDIPAGTTLESFVNIINNDTRNPGVSATLIKSGDGYIFQIQGKETGSENSLEIDYVATTVPGLDNSSLVYDRKADDALFYLENRTTQILRSSSNSVTEVIPGVTLNLTNVTDTVGMNLSDPSNPTIWADPPNENQLYDLQPGASIVLTVTNDTASTKEKIVEFVDTVNELLSLFQELTKYDSSKSTTSITTATSQFDAQYGSVLTGNYGVQLISSELRSLLVGSGKGFNALETDGTGDVFWTLASIGIKYDADESSPTFGQLVIQEGESEAGSPYMTLDEALAHDAEAVVKLLAADKSVRNNSPDFTYVGMLDKSMVNGGEHTVEYDVSGGSVTWVKIDGVYASYDANTNEWTSNADGSKGLVIRVDNLSNGQHSGTLSVQQGKMGELDDFFSKNLTGAGLSVGDSGHTNEKGSLHVLRENYLEIIANIDKKIEQEETRLILWETRQRQMFARLDTLLAQYSAQMEAASAALGSASTNYSGSS